MNEFKLPDVGEGLTEAEIVAWKVAVGDVIKVNDIIVDIETAKSIVELPSPYAGTIEALLVDEGQTVDVGTPIIRIGTGEASGTPSATETAAPSSVQTAGDVVDSDRGDDAEQPEERQKVLVGYGPRTASVKRRARKSAAASVDTEKVAQPESKTVAPEHAQAASKLSTTRALAKPPVRKLAKDLGINLGDVPCEGEIITRAEVEAFAELLQHQDGSAAGVAVVTRDDGPDETRVPIKGVRKWTAEAMVSSAFTAPHVTEWITLDVSKTVALVDRLKADRTFSDVKVSPTLIVAKAVCLAMRRTPELNSRWDGDAQEIVFKKSVNLGIAAATERGLVVPNIRSAESLSLVELAGALGDLTATALAGRTQPEQMSGGTFTITNVGVFGVDGGTPILNPGEAGILCVGAIERRPWVDENDAIVPRWVTTLALSFDHRLVDGEQGSKFLADIAAILRDPELALTY